MVIDCHKDLSQLYICDEADCYAAINVTVKIHNLYIKLPQSAEYRRHWKCISSS